MSKLNMSLEQLHSFYIKKMFDFGYTRFHSNLENNFASRSEIKISNANESSFNDDTLLRSQKRRLSTLSHRSINKSDSKEINFIKSFNKELGRLNEKRNASTTECNNNNDNSLKDSRKNSSAKSNVSSKFFSPSLIICK